jgi:membrane protein implicated in regulation of membrane protease activity
MKPKIAVLDVVAVVKDLPTHKLVMGQVGTVVEILEEGVFEVEFSDESGRTYALLTLPADSLIVLHYEPVAA